MASNLTDMEMVADTEGTEQLATVDTWDFIRLKKTCTNNASADVLI